MADPVSQFATRIAYGARQLPRVAWYIGHGMVMRRLSQAARERAGMGARVRARGRVLSPARSRTVWDKRRMTTPCPMYQATRGSCLAP